MTYRPEIGPQPSFNLIGHRLNDRSDLSVNAENGNVVLKASDVHLAAAGST